VAAVNQKPRQDSFSRRPSGGRFPSDLQVNAQRGLQVPVSPLSVSSGSFNHHDPFTTSVSPPSDFGQPSHGIHDPGRSRGTEGGYFQHATAADGSAGGPGQFSGTVDMVTPQRYTLHDPGPAGQPASTRQNVPPVDTRYDGPAWAEPVPIPVPQQHQQLSSARDSTVGKAYDSRGAATMSGGCSTHKAEPRTSHDDGIHGASGGVTEGDASALPRVAVRSDSVPTISHLHIPGEYPNGAAAGP
jgi:hypothetical protein